MLPRHFRTPLETLIEARFSLLTRNKSQKKNNYPLLRHRILGPRFPGNPAVLLLLLPAHNGNPFPENIYGPVDSPVLPPPTRFPHTCNASMFKMDPRDVSGEGDGLDSRVSGYCAPNPYPIRCSSRVENEAIGLGGMIPREKREGTLYRVLLFPSQGMYYSTKCMYSFFFGDEFSDDY